MRATVVLAIFLAVDAAAQAVDRPTSPTSEAAAAYERKDYAACAEMYHRLAQSGAAGSRNNDLYNAVCCFALAGNKDAAFGALAELVRGGYLNTKALREDADLGLLREDDRWADLFAHAQANWEKKFGADNRELWILREADEDDRRPGVDVKAGAERDRVRLERVKQIVSAGELKTANDYFMAAMLFQHGSQPDNYQQARTLALRAAELDPGNTRALWLAAAARDRYLWSIGKPQMYGTQFHQIDGVWTIEPIDDDVSDSERAKWHVPPLAEAKRRAEMMNSKTE